MASQRPGALDGVKILDLTRVLGGPYCTMILSDHGAAVIKVEPPQGDETRDWGPPFHAQPDGSRDAGYFLGVNRNKRAVSLDIGRPEGADVLLRLLETADVLVENFKPGTMERWGLGYEEVLRARFPRLVHCRVSGFGADGPLGGLPGYDAILQAMSGLMSTNGDREPLRLGTPLVDMATGLYAAVAILMALQERHRSGAGQFIDMTLHDCAMALLHPAAANWLGGGGRPVGTGNRHPNIAPYETFDTATCRVFLAIGNDGQFAKLCRALGLADLAADARFRTNADRLANRTALVARLQGVFADEDGHRLCETLLRDGLPAGPILWVDEALASAHARHREMVVYVEGSRTLGTPIKLSRTPGGPRTAPPAFASATDAVLAEHGFAAGEIEALRASGVLAGARRR